MHLLHHAYSLVEDELKSSKSVDLSTYLTSVLLYVGRMGLGEASLWKLYRGFAWDCAINNSPNVTIKALEALAERNIRDTKLLNAVGNALSQSVESLHPIQVTRIADVFARSGF